MTNASIYGYSKADQQVTKLNANIIDVLNDKTQRESFDGLRFHSIAGDPQSCALQKATHQINSNNYVVIKTTPGNFNQAKQLIQKAIQKYGEFPVAVFKATSVTSHLHNYTWTVIQINELQPIKYDNAKPISTIVARKLDLGKLSPSIDTTTVVPTHIQNHDEMFIIPQHKVIASSQNDVLFNNSDTQSDIVEVRPFTLEPSDLTPALAMTFQDSAPKNTVESSNQPGAYNEHDTITKVLKDHLNADFKPNPKLDNSIVGDLIAQVFTPAVIAGVNDDADGMVIFDPTKGCWVHDESAINSLIRYVKPYCSDMDARNIIKQFAYTAGRGNLNRIVRPYSGSRYLLFKNGCYDTQTDKLYPLNDPMVAKLNFTLRHRLNIDFVRNPKLPQFANGRIDVDDNPNSKPWNPKDFVDGYGDNKPDIVRYFLFGLSLGLFGGHNFGVHFDIQGSSRWGKTTLQKIYANLYENRVITIPFSALNERFAFTNYQLDTATIWIKECNTGASELNGDGGTDIYDALADSNVNFQVKGKNDLVIENPPQVYIDGTQLIQAKELGTGPAGRTMPYELPTMTHELQVQTYSNDIAGMLSRSDVLQWLVWQMIQAYNQVMPTEHDNVVINLTRNDWKKRLPKEFTKWSHDLVLDRSDVSDFFENNIEPYLNPTDDENDPNATIMHDQALYSIWYESFYTNNNPFDPYHNRMLGKAMFTKKIDKIIEQHGWRKVETGSKSGGGRPRKMVKDVYKTHFDVAGYENDFNGLPERLKNSSKKAPAPFGLRVRGWYKLIKIPNPNR